MNRRFESTEEAITKEAILDSWEDEDRNRYFPLGDGNLRVRDGCDGTWRGTAPDTRGLTPSGK
jgi:hypothetical protein